MNYYLTEYQKEFLLESLIIGIILVPSIGFSFELLVDYLDQEWARIDAVLVGAMYILGTVVIGNKLLRKFVTKPLGINPKLKRSSI